MWHRKVNIRQVVSIREVSRGAVAPSTSECVGGRKDKGAIAHP